jgi:hypothetical protein
MNGLEKKWQVWVFVGFAVYGSALWFWLGGPVMLFLFLTDPTIPKTLVFTTENYVAIKVLMKMLLVTGTAFGLGIAYLETTYRMPKNPEELQEDIKMYKRCVLFRNLFTTPFTAIYLFATKIVPWVFRFLILVWHSASTEYDRRCRHPHD